MKKRGKTDAVMLALALFSVSGASLAYNLTAAAGDDISVFFSLEAKAGPCEGELISEYAAVHIMCEDAVTVWAEPYLQEESTLLPPIVTAP